MKAIYWLIIVLVQSCLVPELRADEGFMTKKIVNSELEDLSKSREDLEQEKILLRQVSNSSASENNTVITNRPCQCSGGVCSCCSRILYDTWKQKACVNITYDPDEFSFTANIMMNDRVLYTRTVSGKNPRPICVPVPRLPIRACVRFYNIYFQGRNIHLCLNMEGKFQDTTLFKISLDCLRFGSNGLALLKPEDGGGLGQVELFPTHNTIACDSILYTRRTECERQKAFSVKRAVTGTHTSISRGFLIYRTISITRQSCNCFMSFSCSCCQSVMILYTKERKNLCVNFAYQGNGLNVDVALSSDTISTRTVTNFQAFQFCVFVPGCLFSTACISVLELNQSATSITACPRLDIYAKKRLWQINYDCISISTELPMMSTDDNDDTMRMTDMTIEETSLAENRRSTLSESTIVQTSEMNVTETRPEEAEDITEISEIFEETIPIK
ncbi:hypothetical protein ALC53_07075 [Atta colombica]|uniref:DUF4773 domain-containing protein n=1 Tax=Atta colombica TaxID=520822 RepID=A0A195BEE6_9HYME|nr:hypothetical protein ALC53_07075 [Atta colombica]